MPDLDWNSSLWGGAYGWEEQGEEWSAAWGGSEAQWFGCLYPRLHRFLPARRVLEIAPGYGRWTKYLLAASDALVGIDLSEKCVQACRIRFPEKARFYANDGLSLDAVAGRQFEFVFSFDSLVHAERNVLESYVPQIVRVLAPGGVAFLHHSSFMTSGSPENRHDRATSVSAEWVAELVSASGGQMLHQEVVNWGSEYLTDCFTIFTSTGAEPQPWQGQVLNPDFMKEAALIARHQSPYTSLRPQVAAPPENKRGLRRLWRRNG